MAHPLKFRKLGRCILLHAELEKWASSSPLFQAPELHAKRNNNIGILALDVAEITAYMDLFLV